MQKVIRIWNGNIVVQVITVGKTSGSSTLADGCGAASNTEVDIEIDPWAGYIVERSRATVSATYGPFSWRDHEASREEIEQ